MSTTRRVILISAAIRDEIHSRLHNAPGVDFRGGGDRTFGAFRLQLLTSGPTVVDAYGCDWRLEDAQWVTLRNLIPPDGPVSDPAGHSVWKRNSPDLDTLISWYDVGAPWRSPEEILEDVTRKPRRLRIVAEV